MRLTVAVLLSVIFLQTIRCDGEVSENYSKLLAPSPEIREESQKQLLQTDSATLFADIRTLVLSNETKPSVAQAAIFLLQKKEVSLPQKLLPIANDIPSSQAKAALLAVVELNENDAKSLLAVVSLLRDTNLVVRLQAASLVKNRKDCLEEVLKIGLQALSSDEPEWLGDPPRPAVIIGKQLLTSLKNKKALLDFLNKQSFDSERVKYHLLDLKAVLTRKNSRCIYNHIGNPTAQEIELLSR